MSLKQHSLQDLKNGYAEILGILEGYRSRTGAALRVGESRELVFRGSQGREILAENKLRNLRSFPNADFNKTHGIGNAKWTVQRVGELEKLFASLGLAATGPFWNAEDTKPSA